jgi:hypothetical protein
MGDRNRQGLTSMHSILSRLAIAGMVGVLAASAMAPASAATKQKRAAPAPVAAADDVIGLPIHPAWSPVPAAVYQAPNDCFTDEGYGRYTACDQGGQ